MKNYAHFGHKDFYVALGYKAEVIKRYFLNYRNLNANFTVDLGEGSVTPHQLKNRLESNFSRNRVGYHDWRTR